MHQLNMKQKKDLLNALQMEKAVHIKPTKTQTGGFLGFLASIGIPLAIHVMKKITSEATIFAVTIYNCIEKPEKFRTSTGFEPMTL